MVIIEDYPPGPADASLALPAPRWDLGDVERLVKLVTDRVIAESSKVMYARAIRDFLAWYATSPGAHFDKKTVQRYRTHLLRDGKLAPASVNAKLSAVRALALEAADDDLISAELANRISSVKGIRSAGVRTGKWLTQAQAQALLDAPDPATLKGARDLAVLAVLLGCGLRRAEAAGLMFDHIQQRDGRWVICDLVGKGRRIRSVPAPSWAKAALDAWSAAAGVSTGRVFRSLRKGGRLDGSSLTDQAIRDIVVSYGGPLKLGVAPHDLRRTFAKLALTGEARLEQIQLSLGHASIVTTERYLGTQQDLTDAPCDRLGLRLRSA